MIRETRFLISRKPFAVDLSTLRIQEHTRPLLHGGGCYYSGRIDAVWFRRRKSVTVACIGTLWDFQDDKPTGGPEFLEHHDDGRHGGDCDGRWDGTSYWGNVTLAEQERHLAILRPMLANYPAIPSGYDGWYTFAKAGR